MDAPSFARFSQSTATSWAAQLNLNLAPIGDRTRVAHIEHRGPLRLQRPFYPEQTGCAHLYVLHPPGGVAGGDRLRLEIAAEPGARTLLTVPAANKLYRSKERTARIETRIQVRGDATLEWLPQETIAFSGARAEVSTIVELEAGAKFLGWEVMCLGRPAAKERFESGFIQQRFELWRENQPLCIDCLRLSADGDAMSAVWGLGKNCVVGTFLLAAEHEPLSEPIREVLARLSGPGLKSVSDVEGATVVRYVGPDVREGWEQFVRVWQAVRPLLLGQPAVPPRIWNC